MNMCDEFPEVDKSSKIADLVKDIKRAADSVAELNRIKDELELTLAAMLCHSEEGQKTYYEAGYTIEIKASVNYALDKDEYEAIKNFIPSEFDCVKKTKNEVITYTLDKKVIRNCKTYASDELKKMLFEGSEQRKPLLTEKPRSLTVNIRA